MKSPGKPGVFPMILLNTSSIYVKKMEDVLVNSKVRNNHLNNPHFIQKDFLGISSFFTWILLYPAVKLIFKNFRRNPSKQKFVN